MAILRVFQSIENDVWKLTFVNDPLELSETDKKLMQKFGEPEIDMGGSFGSGGDAFTLPHNYARIRSDFPFTQIFDSTATPFNTDTQTKVLAYRDAIVTSFTTALTTLRETTDTFTGEETYNI